MEAAQLQTVPRLPGYLIKYIVSFRKDYGEYVLNVFKAFMFGIENDDEETRDYKENVRLYIADIAYELLDRWYSLSKETEFILSTNEIMCVYEVLTCQENNPFIYNADFKSDSLNNYLCGRKECREEYLDCIYLLEDTRLIYDEEITKGMPTLREIKYIRLLEMALITKSEDLLKFVRKEMYSPILAFYIYLKHNHKIYRNNPVSLACDDWLINLLMEENCRQEFLCLAISGIFSGLCFWSAGEHNVVYPNLEIVKKIVPEYIKPSEHIPASLCVTDPDEDYPLPTVTPLERWEKYNNIMTIYKKGFESRKVVLPKDETIRDYLISVS